MASSQCTVLRPKEAVQETQTSFLGKRSSAGLRVTSAHTLHGGAWIISQCFGSHDKTLSLSLIYYSWDVKGEVGAAHLFYLKFGTDSFPRCPSDVRAWDSISPNTQTCAQPQTLPFALPHCWQLGKNLWRRPITIILRSLLSARGERARPLLMVPNCSLHNSQALLQVVTSKASSPYISTQVKYAFY